MNTIQAHGSRQLAIAGQSVGEGAWRKSVDAMEAVDGNRGELREVFNGFVAESFYGQMLKAMRDTLDKPAYFHGGRGEEVFQKQLDQIMGERLAEANGGQFAEGMFELQFPPPQRT